MNNNRPADFHQRGEILFIGLSTYGLIAFAVGGSELGYCKHVARFLAGGGVHEEVLDSL